jgi:hypothetical protein
VRVARQDDVLLDEVDLQVELVEGDVVLEVAVEPVGLFSRIVRQASDRLRSASISLKADGPGFRGVSTSTNLRMTVRSTVAA